MQEMKVENKNICPISSCPSFFHFHMYKGMYFGSTIFHTIIKFE